MTSNEQARSNKLRVLLNLVEVSLDYVSDCMDDGTLTGDIAHDVFSQAVRLRYLVSRLYERTISID